MRNEGFHSVTTKVNRCSHPTFEGAVFECQVFFFQICQFCMRMGVTSTKVFGLEKLGLNASNETYYLKVLRSPPAATYGRYWPSVIPGKSHDTVSQSGTSGYRYQNIVCSGAALRCCLITRFWFGPQLHYF